MKTLTNKDGDTFQLLYVTTEDHLESAKKNRRYDLIMRRNNIYHFVDIIPEAEFEVVEPKEKAPTCLPAETKKS